MTRGRKVSVRIMTLVGLLAIAAVTGLVLVSELGRGSRSEAVPGAPLADFSVARFPQGTLASSEFQGRPLVMNFLASWCGPCWEIRALASAMGAGCFGLRQWTAA